MLTDHLGSTSLTTDINGAKVSEMRYRKASLWDKPCPLRSAAGVLRKDEVRYAWTSGLSTTPAYQLTRYTYTGQYSYMDDPTTAGVTEGFGLMFYNARWLRSVPEAQRKGYGPSLGRFAQADTIIPAQSQGVQAWDRFAYVNNAPVNYIDPSGHGGCKPGQRCINPKVTASGVKRDTQTDDLLVDLWDDPEYSDWYSGNYSGCTLCHYAHAQNKSILTNQELATADQNFREWFAVGDTPIVVTSVAVGTPAIGPSVYNLAGVTCLSNTICATLIGAGGFNPTNSTFTASQALDSNLDSGVTVLGYTEDLAYYEGVKVNMLQNVPNYTWEGTNVPFLEQAMARNDTIVFISDFAQYPQRTFPREVLYLLTRNYNNIIDMFRPK